MLCGWVEVYNLFVGGLVGRYTKGPAAVENQCSNLAQKIKSITIKFKYVPISSHQKYVCRSC